jgi:AbrB family looped-hinge helix DNA binding protein
MASRTKTTTMLSTKGQVILPKAIRDQRQWDAGTRLVVENTEAGVLLTQAPLFPQTSHEQVFAMLNYKGPPKSLEDMEEAIAAEVKRRAGS